MIKGAKRENFKEETIEEESAVRKKDHSASNNYSNKFDSYNYYSYGNNQLKKSKEKPNNISSSGNYYFESKNTNMDKIEDNKSYLIEDAIENLTDEYNQINYDD